MLAAYFDESGSPSDCPIVVVAGYIGKVEQLNMLAQNWNSVLKREGITFFRASKFENNRGEFKGWEKNIERKTRFKSDLIWFIKLRILRVVASIVSVADYKKCLTPEDRQKMGGVYAFALQSLFIPISNWARESGYTEPIDIFFEAGNKAGSKMLDVVKKATLREELRKKYRINQIIPLTKDSSPLLQPADLIAYEVFKHHKNQLLDPQRPYRKSVLALGEIKAIAIQFDQKKIDWHVNLMKKSGLWDL